MAGATASPNGDGGPPDLVHDENQTDQPSAAKKRRTGASSRGVANLTPEQLARKRANDREAQRAIRERTKNQIDRLNQRIRELESQQPYHDLQVVLREKDAIQAENADIRKRLEGVLSLIQPILRPSGGLNELAAAAERSPLPIPPLHHQQSQLAQQHQQHPHQNVSRDTHSHSNDPRSFNATLSDIAAAAASPQNSVHSPSGTDAGRSWLFPGDGPTSHMRRYSTESPQFENMRPPQIQTDASFDERLGVDFLLTDNGQRRHVDPNLPPPQQPASNSVVTAGAGVHAPNLVPHLTMPRNISATCPLDVILLDFLVDRQARAAEGVPIDTLVGPRYPNFTSLVHPDRNVDAHPLSRLFTDILRTFPDICGLPEQVAIVFIMFLVSRWMITGSKADYDRLPDWITPRASQLFIPHPAWFEHVPWPKLRDRLITSQPFATFDTFFIPFTTTISLNWPYDPRDCLLPASKIQASSLSATSSIPASSPYSTHVNAGSPPGPPTPQAAGSSPGTFASKLAKEDDQWLINPAFESHLRNLNNWSLGTAFRTTFPSFADLVKIKETR